MPPIAISRADLYHLIHLSATRINAGGTAFLPDQALAALAHAETDFGQWSVPRHEDAFCPNQHGKCVNDIVRRRHRQWGCVACCSWGPWQILYHTASDRGFAGDPVDLAHPAEACYWTCLQINRLISGGVKTLDQLADAWNSGSAFDRIVPAEYVAKVRAAYEKEVSHDWTA